MGRHPRLALRWLLVVAFCLLACRADPVLDELSEPADLDASPYSDSIDANTSAVNPDRFGSFAPDRAGNKVKWHVDGCSYFWALSEAIENAKDTIWIQDWWLSPELYLRRLPINNKGWRLDRTLQRAANRGVQIKIVVYKEVTEVFTLDSHYTKKELEKLSRNIVVFRHPDHCPDKKAIWTEFLQALQDMDIKLTYKILVRLPAAGLRALFGGSEQTTYFWAHHEKLCIVDGKTAFLGGLDLSYGRWDTNDHPIADLHHDREQVIFPGQDYNNARVMDFHDVARWMQNKLDRRYTPRMGWSDMGISMMGPSVADLRSHFIQRWNWIYKQKYVGRGQPLSVESDDSIDWKHKKAQHGPQRAEPITDDPHESRPDRKGRFPLRPQPDPPKDTPVGSANVQVVRSAGLWSTGVATESSVMAAYASVIRNSKHFVYIENQFFITSSDNAHRKPVLNKLGQVIVERIIKAHKARETYKIIVVLPAIPAFAGDIKSEAGLSARAIMEFQYYSIIRGGHSIFDLLKAAGVDPSKYIRFYNLRNYDRINTPVAPKGPTFSTNFFKRGSHPRSLDEPQPEFVGNDTLEARGLRGGVFGGADSITRAYMTPKVSLYDLPWNGTPQEELDAFVTEQLYVHTKLLIADDKTVIIGSANINDRSQLGERDSEIAIVVEDTASVLTTMNGRPYLAGRFAASLRRFITRKHLGLVPSQDYTAAADPAFQPVTAAAGNKYDWGSAEDKVVADPLGSGFQSLWQGTARGNTAAFRSVFRPVPDDAVRTWAEYDAYYARFYPQTSPWQLLKWFSKAQKEGHAVVPGQPSTWKWGHVVAEEFPGGIRDVKKVLDTVRGTLVEMPLHFLIQEDIAKWGLKLNPGTEQIYT